MNRQRSMDLERVVLRMAPLGARSTLPSVLVLAGLVVACSGGRTPNSDVGPVDGLYPDLGKDMAVDTPGHPDWRNEVDRVQKDLFVDAQDIREAVPSDLDVVDQTDGADMELDASKPEDADAVDAPDLEVEPDVPFWKGYWDDSIPWDPGVCQSVDEGYLPGGAPTKPCNFGSVGGIIGAHGVYLKQVQRFANAPCGVPQCLDTIPVDGIMLRVHWKDKAAELTLGAFCEKNCPWDYPAACEKHKFPPKIKAYVFDYNAKTISFVRNELTVSEFKTQCGPYKCTTMLSLPVLEEELCAAPVIVYGLHPSAAWANLGYFCWKETLATGVEVDVCVMHGFGIGYGVDIGITYDVLTDELMNYDYTALTCFALVDGECIDLPLGLP